MKTKDYIFIGVIIALCIALFLVNGSRVSSDDKIADLKAKRKRNLYQIDSLNYKYDILEIKQDTLLEKRKRDSVLLMKKQKGINTLYNLLKNKNEEINSSSSTDDYEYLLNLSE